MYKKALLALCLATVLPGCTSLLATASGPEPLGVKEGQRTLSMRLEDNSIETTANVNIYKADPAFKDANITVVSFYGSVLMAGQVQTEELKKKAEEVVNRIGEVKRVHNELVVGNVPYYLARANDGIISTRIRSSMTFDSAYPSSRTKIATVNGVVYLMGKLTKAEADRAVQIISDTSGVMKIVKLVDYLPDGAAPATTDNKKGA